MSSDLRRDLTELIYEQYDGDQLCAAVVTFLKARGVATDNGTLGIIDNFVYRAKCIDFLGPEWLAKILADALDISEAPR